MPPPYTTDPYTGIRVPTVGVDSGPDYATNISAALTKLAGLTHTGAGNNDGKQIPSAGLLVNADLTWRGFNLTNLRTLRLANQGAPVSSIGDVGCVYERAGDLWYNNAGGVAIQLTAGPNVISALATSYALITIVANHTINPTDSVNFIAVNSAGGSFSLQLPASNSVPSGRFYLVKDLTGSAGTHPVTVMRAGSDTIDGAASDFALTGAHQSALFISSLGNWMLFAEGDFGALTAKTLTTTGDAAVGGNISALQHKITNAVTETRVIRLTPFYVTNVAFTLNNNVSFSTHDGTSGCSYSVDFPNGVKLTSVDLYVLPGAHGGFLPAVTNSFSLTYYDLTSPSGATGANNIIAPLTDPTTPTATYDAFHHFTGTALAGGHVVDRTKYKYILTVAGENDVTHGVNGGLVVSAVGTWARLAASVIGED